MSNRVCELIHTTFIDGVSGALSMIPEIHSDYTRFNEKFDEVTNRLYRNWDGKGAEAFEEDTIKIRQNIQSLYVQLKELWDTLCDCNELIKLADGQIGLVCRETGAQLSFDTWIEQMRPGPGGAGGATGGGTLEHWASLTGTSVSSVNNRESRYFWSSGNLSHGGTGRYVGQCTWYAYGRFWELTGIQLPTARHARYWLTENRNNPNVMITNTIQAPSIAVNTTGGGGFGHVLIIEHIERDAHGNPLYVFFTEANGDVNHRHDDNVDGILIRMSYSEFRADPNRRADGFIVAK